MKMRNDFVSNSSSCSFIINDALAFKTAVEELECESAYDLHCFEVYVVCSPEDRKFFEHEMGMSDAYEYDGELRFSSNIESVFALSEENLKKVKSIELQCDDYETSSMFLLSVLKKALENMGVPVDSSSSEHPLMLEDEENYDGNKFLRNVCYRAFADARK